MNSWGIYRGNGERQIETPEFPAPPPWRQSGKNAGDITLRQRDGETIHRHVLHVTDTVRDLVNAAIYLRRPLLVTGLPGTGKTSLASSIAYELNLGNVLRWSITSRSTVKEALYNYDAVGRLQEASLTRDLSQHHLIQLFAKTKDEIDSDVVESIRRQFLAPPIEEFLRLGSLGTALATSTVKKPRVLLIDEFDKSDIDLANDLLNIFEMGKFTIPELERDKRETIYVRPVDDDELLVDVKRGSVESKAFPIVVITSNGEREFPAPFLRRCLSLQLKPPTKEQLEAIVRSHFSDLEELSQIEKDKVNRLISQVIKLRENNGDYVAVDQLLNAVHLVKSAERKALIDQQLYTNHVLSPIARVSNIS